MTSKFISVISDGQITTDGVVSQSHFKKFECSPNGYVIGITGYEMITNQIRKKFYYQPALDFNEAKSFLTDQLEHYKSKQVEFGHAIRFNAIIAGFSEKNIPQATTFHIENQKITAKNYGKSAILSLVPDRLDFNPNQLIHQYLENTAIEMQLLQVQTLQRSVLYQVSEHSATVNKVVFQETVYPH